MLRVVVVIGRWMLWCGKADISCAVRMMAAHNIISEFIPFEDTRGEDVLKDSFDMSSGEHVQSLTEGDTNWSRYAGGLAPAGSTAGVVVCATGLFTRAAIACIMHLHTTLLSL